MGVLWGPFWRKSPSLTHRYFFIAGFQNLTRAGIYTPLELPPDLFRDNFELQRSFSVIIWRSSLYLLCIFCVYYYYYCVFCIVWAFCVAPVLLNYLLLFTVLLLSVLDLRMVWLLFGVFFILFSVLVFFCVESCILKREILTAYVFL